MLRLRRKGERKSAYGPLYARPTSTPTPSAQATNGQPVHVSDVNINGADVGLHIAGVPPGSVFDRLRIQNVRRAGVIIDAPGVTVSNSLISGGGIRVGSG